ncbi:hypothetical protein [Mesorhizobium sp. M0601]|uniref:hypothetical protein n=1 Tax=unclassified Mesorhizobium TaxID=325217 RepID=UPI0033354BDC
MTVLNRSNEAGHLDGRGRYHPVVEFAGGVVSGPLFFVIATAILLSTLYIGAAISERIQAHRRLHPSAEPGAGFWRRQSCWDFC